MSNHEVTIHVKKVSKTGRKGLQPIPFKIFTRKSYPKGVQTKVRGGGEVILDNVLKKGVFI